MGNWDGIGLLEVVRTDRSRTCEPAFPSANGRSPDFQVGFAPCSTTRSGSPPKSDRSLIDNVRRYDKHSSMRPFLPVLTFVVVSFFLLAAWINYSNPDYALRPLLYLARLVAWLVAMSISQWFSFVPSYSAASDSVVPRCSLHSPSWSFIHAMVFSPLMLRNESSGTRELIVIHTTTWGQIISTDPFHLAPEAVVEAHWMPDTWHGSASRMGYL